MKIIDTHCHLDKIEDMQGAIERAVEARVSAIVVIAMNLKSSRKILELKQQIENPVLYVGLGMHPSETNLDDVEELKALIYDNREQLHCIGEIGLDYWYKWVRHDEQKKQEQRTAFRALLDVARDLDLPAVIHSRGAWGDAYDMVCEAGVKKAVFHWYDGSLKVLKKIMKDGYFVSTTPNLGYNGNTQSAVAATNFEQLLIETDSPVRFFNRKTEEEFTAEPKDVWRTLKAYCKLNNITEEDALAQFNANAKTLFNIK